MERDIRNLSWRQPSYLNDEAKKEWAEALDKCGLDSVIMVNFLGESGGKPYRTWEPMMKIWGGWRGLGRGAKMDSERVVNLQELERIDFLLYNEAPKDYDHNWPLINT